MQSSANTILGACRQAIRYLEDRYLLVGVGNISRWPVEGSPPRADSSLLVLPEVVTYFPPLRQTVIYLHPQGEIELINGDRCFALSSTDPYELAQAGGFRVLIEATIQHSDLREIDAYRSVGLFTGCVVLDLIDSFSGIPSSRVQAAYLDHLIHLERPFIRAAGVQHKIQIVKNFYTPEGL